MKPLLTFLSLPSPFSLSAHVVTDCNGIEAAARISIDLAGYNRVNGMFYFEDMHNGRPRYKNPATDAELLWEGDSQKGVWSIVHEGFPRYSISSTDYVPPVTRRFSVAQSL